MQNQNVESANNVRKLFTSDLDSVERKAVQEIENKLGKKIGEVSEQQVLDSLNSLFPYNELGGSEGRYKEFVADLKRAYSEVKSGKIRTSNF
jgi:hypothetical protein